MSYQRSRAIRTTSLKDLILDRTVQGRGLGSSIVSSIKDKTIADVKGITEKFDPLNIATAFGGSLGGYAFGRLTRRSKEDISYFTGRGGRGSFMDSRKNKNPLVTKVGAGEDRPTKKGEGLADIMARIFNLIKKNSEQVKKRQEITANFEEEKEDERALRHKELIETISNMNRKRKKLGSVTEVGKDGMFSKLLDMVKNMIEKTMKAIKPILDFVRTIMKALGGKVVKFLQFLGALGTEGVLGILLPATAAAALLWLVKSEKDKILANPDAPEYRNTPFAQKVRGEVKTEKEAAARNQAQARRQVPRKEVEDLLKTDIPDSDLIKEYGANRIDMKKWLDKTKDDKVARWQRPLMDSGGNIVIKGGDTREDLRVTPPYLQTPRQKGFQPGGSTVTEMKNVDTTPTTSATNSSTRSAVTPMTGQDRGAFIPESKPVVTPAASPVSSTTNPVTGRMSMAQRQNLDLNLDVATVSEPIIIDKSKVIAGGDSGGVDIIKSASVRIDNPTLKGIQKQSLRSFA